MKRWRSNGESVSPVIATILMVAITVVLAAVLYVLVSGFFDLKRPPIAMGVNVSRENDGNYSMKIISAPNGLAESQLRLSVVRSAQVLIGKVPVLTLACTTHGAVWVQTDPSSTTAGPGDFVVLSGSGTGCPGAPGNTFQAGDKLEFSDGTELLWSGHIN